MDWIDWNFITGMFAGATAWVLGWFGPGLVRALRRSEPKSRDEPFFDSNGKPHRSGSRCPTCNPQPTQSERRSEAGAGKNGG